MDMFWWFVGIVAGVVIGRITAPEPVSKTSEKLKEEIRRLHEDIVYYKKLTRNLVEENKQLKNLND